MRQIVTDLPVILSTGSIYLVPGIAIVTSILPDEVKSILVEYLVFFIVMAGEENG
jgi:hypothetical protein